MVHFDSMHCVLFCPKKVAMVDKKRTPSKTNGKKPVKKKKRATQRGGANEAQALSPLDQELSRYGQELQQELMAYEQDLQQRYEQCKRQLNPQQMDHQQLQRCQAAMQQTLNLYVQNLQQQYNRYEQWLLQQQLQNQQAPQDNNRVGLGRIMVEGAATGFGFGFGDDVVDWLL